jgi:hypothetical protein
MDGVALLATCFSVVTLQRQGLVGAIVSGELPGGLKLPSTPWCIMRPA